MVETRKAGGKLLLRRSPEERKPLVARLNRIEGQVRGLRAMIDEDRYCGDELQQIKAIIAALREVGLLLVEQHASAAIRDGGQVMIKDLLRVLRESSRL